MKPDRTVAPKTQSLLPPLIADGELPVVFKGLKFNAINLDNGIPLIVINDPSTELLRIEILVEAGITHQQMPLQAQMCARMLKEGSDEMTGNELAKLFDYYGAYTNAGALPDLSAVNLVVLKRYSQEVLLPFARMITHPVFSLRPFRRVIEERRQEFTINQDKVAWEARRRLMNLLFGEKHPYGHLLMEEDYRNLTTNALQHFHAENYFSKGIRILVTGNADSSVRDALAATFGTIPCQSNQQPPAGRPLGLSTSEKKEWIVNREGSLQTAIRMGCLVPKMSHPDFIAIQIAVSALGGYFGSRLNLNLRESKGYTYGVGAGLIPMKDHSVLTISAEVDAHFSEAAVAAITDELRDLASNPPAGEELKTLLTYLAGSFLRSVDGSFALSERIRAVNDFGLDHRFYAQYLTMLQTITPETISRIAATWLNPDRMTIVRVGK